MTQCLPNQPFNATSHYGVFESRSPTYNSDRVCGNILTVCNSTNYTAPIFIQYESTKATLTTDRVCSLTTMCNTSCFQFQLPGNTQGFFTFDSGLILVNGINRTRGYYATADRQCALLNVCNFPAEFIGVPSRYDSFQFLSQRTCNTTSVCNATQYQQRDTTNTSDRVCRWVGDVSSGVSDVIVAG